MFWSTSLINRFKLNFGIEDDDYYLTLKPYDMHLENLCTQK